MAALSDLSKANLKLLSTDLESIKTSVFFPCTQSIKNICKYLEIRNFSSDEQLNVENITNDLEKIKCPNIFMINQLL